MLQIRDHDVDDYAALRDMDHTDVGVLDDSDRACLREIGDYLTKTDAWQRIAMWLLHKHFEPLDGEVFVERAIPSRGWTETTPAPRSSFSTGGLYASAIRFDATEHGPVALIGLEFAEPADFGDVAPLGADDESVMAHIAETLRAHGKIDRFGIKLIRDPLGLSEGELLLETCDVATRIQLCEIGSRDNLPSDRSIIETTWRWRLVQGASRPVVMQECTAGCTPAVGEGHVLAHRHSQFDNDDNPIDPVYP